MVEVRSYKLPATPLIPNSPRPLLHYPGLIPEHERAAELVYDRFISNGWETQWIWRYGPTQASHYHSRAHECMAVLTGTARIRFGVADTSEDPEENTFGDGREPGGVELLAQPGDVFVIPAGVTHKTFGTENSVFTLLTPGHGHGVESSDPRQTIKEIRLNGFTMIGAYPIGGEWDHKVGGEDEGQYETVWSVPVPPLDPILGDSPEGLVGHWSTK